MKEKIAEFTLEPEEAAEAIAFRISETHLKPSHFWNHFNVAFTIRDGKIVSITASYYLDEEGRKAAKRDGLL